MKLQNTLRCAVAALCVAIASLACIVAFAANAPLSVPSASATADSPIPADGFGNGLGTIYGNTVELDSSATVRAVYLGAAADGSDASHAANADGTKTDDTKTDGSKAAAGTWDDPANDLTDFEFEPDSAKNANRDMTAVVTGPRSIVVSVAFGDGFSGDSQNATFMYTGADNTTHSLTMQPIASSSAADGDGGSGDTLSDILAKSPTLAAKATAVESYLDQSAADPQTDLRYYVVTLGDANGDGGDKTADGTVVSLENAQIEFAASDGGNASDVRLPLDNVPKTFAFDTEESDISLSYRMAEMTDASKFQPLPPDGAGATTVPSDITLRFDGDGTLLYKVAVLQNLAGKNETSGYPIAYSSADSTNLSPLCTVQKSSSAAQYGAVAVDNGSVECTVQVNQKKNVTLYNLKTVDGGIVTSGSISDTTSDKLASHPVIFDFDKTPPSVESVTYLGHKSTVSAYADDIGTSDVFASDGSLCFGIVATDESTPLTVMSVLGDSANPDGVYVNQSASPMQGCPAAAGSPAQTIYAVVTVKGGKKLRFDDSGDGIHLSIEDTHGNSSRVSSAKDSDGSALDSITVGSHGQASLDVRVGYDDGKYFQSSSGNYTSSKNLTVNLAENFVDGSTDDALKAAFRESVRQEMGMSSSTNGTAVSLIGLNDLTRKTSKQVCTGTNDWTTGGSDGDGSYSCTISSDGDDSIGDGDYSVTVLGYSSGAAAGTSPMASWLSAGSGIGFVVDSSRPTLSVTRLPEASGDISSLTVTSDGGEEESLSYYPVYGKDAPTITLKVQDLFPDAANANFTGMNQEGTSGLDTKAFGDSMLKVTYPAVRYMNGNEKIQSRTVMLPYVGDDGSAYGVHSDGSFDLTLSDSGMYRLDEFTIEARDNAGNHLGSDNAGAQLAEAVNSYLDSTGSTKRDNVGAIVVSLEKGLRTSVTVSGDDRSGNGQYYRGNLKVTVTVVDPLFPQNNKSDYKGYRLTFVNKTLAGQREAAAQKGSWALQELDDDTYNYGIGDGSADSSDDKTSWKNTTGDTWTRVYSLPVGAKGDNAGKVLEGDYTVAVYYAGATSIDVTSDSAVHDAIADGAVLVSGDGAVSTDGIDQTGTRYKDMAIAKAGAAFVYDSTSPRFGRLAVSAKGGTKVGGYYASPSAITITIEGVTDGVSGVDAGTLAFKADDGGTIVDAVSYTKDGGEADASDLGLTFSQDDATGTITLTLNQDDQRLDLSKTSIYIEDRAGNYQTTGALNQYDRGSSYQSNPFEDVTTAITDFTKPTLSIAYDNNDVRNGKYYAAGRTATVTVADNTFDALQTADPDRVIVTVTLDDRTAGYTAKDFSQDADGDWVLTLDCGNDGDWTLQAGFNDIAGNASDTVDDEFTVDTISPVLTLSFDNNDARNGNYYNADRTATLAVVDRNLDTGDASAVHTSFDGEADKGPQGMWERKDADAKPSDSTVWIDSVTFSSDGRYTLDATVTDLAGNVSNSVSEGEFIIDETNPLITVSGIEDQTAYNGTVAPSIDFTDTNIDAQTITYSLVGARDGDMTGILGSSIVNSDDGSQYVSYDDFPHELSNDDVYTLQATLADKAGNTATQTIRFSVNRFGSTYFFEGATGSLRGAYLKQAQPVTVTEINVSGLDTNRSEITVAHGSDSRKLGSKEYKTAVSTDRGWSRTTYTLPATLFSKDGYYRVLLSSRDLAGNLSQNTMKNKNATRDGGATVMFAVDGTAPESSAVGIESNRTYVCDSKRIGIGSKDNLGIKSVTLIIDGKERGTWTGDEVESMSPSTTIRADNASHTITVRTEDLAGNVSTTTYDGVVVATTTLQYLERHTNVLLVVIIASVLALLVIAIVVAVLIHRRRYLSGLGK